MVKKMNEKIIKFGFPDGSLKEATLRIFKKAGYNVTIKERNYFPRIDDDEIECSLIRTQEIPKYVANGVLDFGIAGKDWIEENNADVIEIAELHYSRASKNPVKLVLAVPIESKIKTIKDLEGKRIATELVKITERYLKEKGVNAEVEFSWGATEAKPPELVDAIVELTETGSSLRANNLRIIDTILVSTTRLIANKDSYKDKWKKSKIDKMSLLLKSVLDAEENVGLKMNLPNKKIKQFEEIMIGLRSPTISQLGVEGWVSVEVVVKESIVREIIPKLKELGAEGIIEYPLNKLIS